jgi:hypothetical protein
MKWALLLSLALSLQGCYRPYFKEEKWAYFEDWDLNRDRVLDKEEFKRGFEDYKLFEKLSPRSEPITYEQFDKRVSSMAEKTGEKPEDKPTASSLDPNGDQKISKDEIASAMFVVADDNRNNEVSSFEFYEWQVYL